MAMKLLSRDPFAPFEIPYAVNYNLGINTPQTSVAKTSEENSYLKVLLEIPKSEFQKDNIQALLHWGEEPITSEYYYRDLAVQVSSMGALERSIVFTHAQIQTQVTVQTQTLFFLIEVIASQKKDKLSGMLFGTNLEKTYQKAWEKVNNPPKIHIFTSSSQEVKMMASRPKYNIPDLQSYLFNIRKMNFKNPNDIKKLIKDGSWKYLFYAMEAGFTDREKDLPFLKTVYEELYEKKNTNEFETLLKNTIPSNDNVKTSLSELKEFCKNYLISSKQLKEFGWAKTDLTELEYFNKVLTDYKITSKESIRLFMATIGHESGKGTIVLEKGNDAYFESQSYTKIQRGAGYMQLTKEEVQDNFIKHITRRFPKKEFSGNNRPAFIAENYPLESAAWYWTKGCSKNLNEYVNDQKEINKEVFLITQYFVNGYLKKESFPDFDSDLNYIKTDGKNHYEIIYPGKGEKTKNKWGDLIIHNIKDNKERTYRLPNNWEDRENNYEKAKEIF